MARITFAIVVGNDVAGTVSLEENASNVADGIIAAYRSDPKIIEVSDASIGLGWTYDGTNFTPPAE